MFYITFSAFVFLKIRNNNYITFHKSACFSQLSNIKKASRSTFFLELTLSFSLASDADVGIKGDVVNSHFQVFSGYICVSSVFPHPVNVLLLLHHNWADLNNTALTLGNSSHPITAPCAVVLWVEIHSSLLAFRRKAVKAGL